MSKKRKQNNRKNMKITAADYLKAIKKADREIQLEQSTGWAATHKVHKSKKIYNRTSSKTFLSEE